MIKRFDDLLNKSVTAHGHLCAGQILGVRLAMLGLALLGYEAPLDDHNIKKVIIYVEIDRCAADAVGTVTGVRLGRRSLKFKDYGLMAATFVDLSVKKAYRVAVKEDCRDKAAERYPRILDQRQREITAYREMSAEDLFQVDEVHVDVPPEDLPGFRGEKAFCDVCGTVIRHRREVVIDGRTLCAACAGNAYFKPLRRVTDLEALDPKSNE